MVSGPALVLSGRHSCRLMVVPDTNQRTRTGTSGLATVYVRKSRSWPVQEPEPEGVKVVLKRVAWRRSLVSRSMASRTSSCVWPRRLEKLVARWAATSTAMVAVTISSRIAEVTTSSTMVNPASPPSRRRGVAMSARRPCVVVGLWAALVARAVDRRDPVGVGLPAGEPVVGVVGGGAHGQRCGAALVGAVDAVVGDPRGARPRVGDRVPLEVDLVVLGVPGQRGRRRSGLVKHDRVGDDTRAHVAVAVGEPRPDLLGAIAGRHRPAVVHGAVGGGRARQPWAARARPVRLVAHRVVDRQAGLVGVAGPARQRDRAGRSLGVARVGHAAGR